MFNIPGISLGRANKHYTHDLSFDNNTTASIGVCQPLLCQYLMPHDKAVANLRQLVRLAPMPVPSFARLSYVNKVRFVPITDVQRNFESLLSQTSVNTNHLNYVPTNVLRVSNKFLVYILCTLADTEVSFYLGSSGSLKVVRSYNFSTLVEKFFPAYKDTLSFRRNIEPIKDNNGSVDDPQVTADNADFIMSPSNAQMYAMFRLGRIGRILRSIFVGLGYSLNITDDALVSALPLLAYFKAYYDAYYPKRDSNFYDTSAYKIIDTAFEYNYDDLTDMVINGGSVLSTAIYQFFLQTLGDSFATYPDDYLSVHRTSANVAEVGKDMSRDVLQQPWSSSLHTVDTIKQNSGSNYTISANTGALTLTALQTLQRLQRFINKDSVIGQRVSKWLQVHFGDSAVSDFFKDSTAINDIVTRCDVDDIFSQSDTIDANGNGDYLGAYAGKGLGFNKSGFSFTAPTFGYLIVIGAVIPRLGYCEGNDPTLYGVDRFTLPSADFDALGYELTPAMVAYSDHGLSTTSTASSGHRGFGFIPRFSGYKVKRDIVNGDISRRSTAPYLSCYHLDRITSSVSFTQRKVAADTYSFSYDGGVPIPNASQSWRYISKYPWLSNLNRIFYNESANRSVGDLSVEDDAFIVQTVFDFKVTNSLKPISQSFDTFEESADNSSVNVNAE